MSDIILSLIIPTLNRPEKLSALVEKISNHSTPEVEWIIVDDSAQRWKESDSALVGKSQVYLHRGKKLGVSSARNEGAKKAKGKYLLFLDDDDDFSPTWISDFLQAMDSDPEVVFCEMIRVNLDGSNKREIALVEEGNQLIHAIFIPGAWVIKKDFFNRIGGYDERLAYAENTELFIRIQMQKVRYCLVPKANFIYHPSPNGGSKNLQNMVESLNLILGKHDATLNSHVKHLYHQIIGVNYLRFSKFGPARIHFAWAILFKPWKPATWGRFGIACIPFLAKKFYSTQISYA